MILDQFGRPFRAGKAPEQVKSAAPLSDAWREYVTSGLTPERLAAVFREADAGDIRRQAELFDQLEERDAHILGEAGKRRNAILTVDFRIIPASEESRDLRVAGFVQDLFERLELDELLIGLQESVGRGFSGHEVCWDVSMGQALPVWIRPLAQKRFLFTGPDGILSPVPRLITDDHPMGMEIPAWAVLLHRYGGQSGHPARAGVFRVCAWMYLFKSFSVKDWVIFCEVYGMPLRLGKYSPGASKEDKEALIDAISTLGSDAAGIISKSTEIDFVETKTTASGALYESLAGFCNREISKALLGQTLSAEVGDRGSYAASRTHNEVRLDLLKADARAVASTIRRQLIRPVVGFNFGWETPLPGFAPVFEKQEDLGEKAAWISQLMDRGLEIPLSYLREQFRIPKPSADEEVLVRRPEPRITKLNPQRGINPQRGYKPPKRAEGGGKQDDLQSYTGQALGLAGPVLEGLAGPVRELVMSASSLEELRDRLLDAYADMDPMELGKLMAQALTVAELAGRAGATDFRGG